MSMRNSCRLWIFKFSNHIIYPFNFRVKVLLQSDQANGLSQVASVDFQMSKFPYYKSYFRMNVLLQSRQINGYYNIRISQVWISNWLPKRLSKQQKMSSLSRVYVWYGNLGNYCSSIQTNKRTNIPMLKSRRVRTLRSRRNPTRFR